MRSWLRAGSARRRMRSSFSGQRVTRLPSSSSSVFGRSTVKSKNGSGSIPPTTGATRSDVMWSSASVATWATSNQPLKAITMIGRCNGARPSVARVRTSATSTVLAPQRVHDVVDARRERGDVVGLDRREHADAQLVAAELAVAVGVDDAVGAQRRVDIGGIDAIEVDRADDRRALGRVGDERRRPVALAGPAVEVRGRRLRALGAPVETAI